MKKVIVLSLCIAFLFVSATETFADVSHFEDGHETDEFDDFGISLEIPSDWKDKPLESAFAFFPDGTDDVIWLLSIVNLESDNGEFDDILLITANDSAFTGITGEDQKGKSRLMTLSNGNNAAVASYYIDTETKDTFMMASTMCGKKMVVLGFKASLEKYEEEYIDDLDAILCSAKEI